MATYKPRVLDYDYLLNIRVWHQVTRKHLVGLAGEVGESKSLLLGNTIAQHRQFCTATYGKAEIYSPPVIKQDAFQSLKHSLSRIYPLVKADCHVLRMHCLIWACTLT